LVVVVVIDLGGALNAERQGMFAALPGKVCGGPGSSDRFFGFLSGKIIQFVVVEAVEM